MTGRDQLAVRDALVRKTRVVLAPLAAAVLVATGLALREPPETEVAGSAPAAVEFDAADPASQLPPETPSDVAAEDAPTATTAGGTASNQGPDEAPTPVDTADSGVARSGVPCTPGARQVPWSVYAPMCVPEFSGDNGGATSPGVTAETITLTYRRQGSAQAATVRAIAGEAVPVDSEYLHDLQAYANLFNATYELYGRKVVFAPFDGKGDYLTEDMGQGQQAANADGITARELGGFADVTFASATSPFYTAALQSQGVIAYGFPVAPQSWYEQNSPWQYNTFVSGTAWAAWASNLVCQRLGTGPVDFAGDESMHGSDRVYGLVAVEFPTWLQTADEIVAGIESRCGITMARRATYAENLGTMQQDASAIAAQMKSAGVTTLICFCDPLIPIFLTDAATRQGYRPEWIVQNQFDPIAQVADQSQFAHAIAPGPANRAGEQSEAYAAYKMADPDGEPASIYYPVAYQVMLHVFGVLQSAGPNLTPTTFRDGAFAMPPSLRAGEFGLWGSGPGRYTPTSGVGIVRWDPDAVSSNGNRGSWEPCEDGAIFPFADPAAWRSGPVAC